MVEVAFLLLCENNGFGESWINGQAMLLAALGILFTFIGVSGFLREKETGMLDFILLSPLSINRIIAGHLFGLCDKFLPAMSIVAGCYFTVRRFSHDRYWPVELIPYCIFSLPFFVIYFGLWLKNVFPAVILTAITLISPPFIVSECVDFADHGFGVGIPFFESVVFLYATFTIAAYFRVYRNLSRRRYSF
jgi:hypothetical protein